MLPPVAPRVWLIDDLQADLAAQEWAQRPVTQTNLRDAIASIGGYYPKVAGETGVVATAYAYGDVRRFGAVGDWTAPGVGTDNTAAFQAAADYCSFSNSISGTRPEMLIPPGAFRVTGKIRLKATRIRIRGAGMYNSVIHYEGVAAGCLVFDNTLTYGNPNFSDFSIVGDASSGPGIDCSGPSDFTYNASFERMQIYAGQQAIYAPRLFSSKIDTVLGSSINNHAFHVNCGPSVGWFNAYALSAGAGKAGYRLTGTIRMYSCNGLNSGDYWGVFGSNPSGSDGFQNDFAGIGYPDIELYGCNYEAWNTTAVLATQSAQQFKICGGTVVRTLGTNYHSVFRAALNPLSTFGYIELDGVRSIISGGTATGANVWSDASGSLLLKNDSTGFTTFWSVTAGAFVAAVIEDIRVDVAGNRALNISDLMVGRLTSSKPIILTGVVGSPGPTVRYIGSAGSASIWWHNVPTGGSHTFAVNDVASAVIDVIGVRPPADSTLKLGRPTFRWAELNVMREIAASITVVYSAAMTIDASLGNTAVITATNATAFTINAPTNPVIDQVLTVMIRNTSGGALGVATWNAIFKMVAWVQPATGFSRSISFRYDGTNWVETLRSAADVPN